MIKITYTITFAEPGQGLACFTIPPELMEKISTVRTLADSLGCLIDPMEVNEDYTRMVVHHIWQTQEMLDTFYDEANKLLDYDAFFTEYQEYIASAEGTLIRTIAEV